MTPFNPNSFFLRIPLLAQHLFFLIFIGVFGCAHITQPDRIVAVGDVHGAYNGFTDILQEAELIDETHSWIGGKSILVQMGDFTDRGGDVRSVMDLLMALEKQAAKQGGQVITLMGNHEAYNLMGYFDRQSTPLPVFTRICESFADTESRFLRENAYRQYQAWQNRYPQCALEDESQWMNTHPLGFVEMQNALNSSGKYGQWLRSRPAVIQLGSTLFVHGGISPELNRLNYTTPDRVNIALKAEIDRFDQLKEDLLQTGDILSFSTLEDIECVLDQKVRKAQTDPPSEASAEQLTQLNSMQGKLPGSSAWMELSSEGPLWFRGYATWTEEEGNVLVDEIMKIWGVEQIIVGHTPIRNGRIWNRFNNRIFLIDTGMVYGKQAGINGQPSALEIKNEEFTAIYKDGRIPLTDEISGMPQTNAVKIPPSYPDTQSPESSVLHTPEISN